MIPNTEYITWMEAELEKARFELKAAQELHRMQLAAISTTAGADTRESADKCRLRRAHAYWTPTYNDVRRMVDRKMRLLEERNQTNECLGKIRDALLSKDPEVMKLIEDTLKGDMQGKVEEPDYPCMITGQLPPVNSCSL
jgi:hypothetical protein